MIPHLASLWFLWRPVMSCHVIVTMSLITPSVPCSMQQSGFWQASPCHDVVKQTYFWLTTTSRRLDKPCNHGVFNAVVSLFHHMAKVSKYLQNLTWLNSCFSVFAHMYTCSVIISFIQKIRNNFLMYLFSKPGYISLPSSSMPMLHIHDGQINNPRISGKLPLNPCVHGLRAYNDL